jgi:16S rRNA processing protein RimM
VSDDAPRVAVGRVGRAHGLDGSFYVTRAVSRLLTLGTSVTVAGRSAEIVRRAGTDARPIVRLQGVGDRAAAAALRGSELTVVAASAPQLGEGEWWAHELEGCEVFADERRLGSVARLIELPSCETLEVREHGGETLLVPLVRDAIRQVDTGARRIDVDGEFLGLPGGDVDRGGGVAEASGGEGRPRDRDAEPSGGTGSRGGRRGD